MPFLGLRSVQSSQQAEPARAQRSPCGMPSPSHAPASVPTGHGRVPVRGADGGRGRPAAAACPPLLCADPGADGQRCSPGGGRDVILKVILSLSFTRCSHQRRLSEPDSPVTTWWAERTCSGLSALPGAEREQSWQWRPSGRQEAQPPAPGSVSGLSLVSAGPFRYSEQKSGGKDVGGWLEGGQDTQRKPWVFKVKADTGVCDQVTPNPRLLAGVFSS